MAEKPDAVSSFWAHIGPDAPLRFDDFLNRALIDPRVGFYARSGAAGRAGDFVTSPAIGGLFGRCVATFLDGEWDRLGRPDRFHLVDLGAGGGQLARTVVAAQPRCSGALVVSLVDIDSPERAARAETVAFCAARGVTCVDVAEHVALDRSSGSGVVIANELADNLAFRLLRRQVGGFEEGWVLADRSLEWRPVDISPDHFGDVEVGRAFPWAVGAQALVDRWRGVFQGGSLVLIDYGAPTTAEVAGRDGWLRTYRAHSVGMDPLAVAGDADITADVPFDQLPRPDRLMRQADALSEWGLADMVAAARVDVDRLAAGGGLDWVRARSTVSEAAALTEVPGLGSFLVAIWSV